MKKFIIVTGGSGFVGSNLIEYLIKKTKYNIISLDDYSSGTKKNHIKSKKVKYIKGNTKDIDKILKRYVNEIHSIFHFGEFSRIYQSFLNMNTCIKSNSIGTNAVFNFCLKNKIKLENLNRWFNFKYEVIFFYNVYGPGQITKGNMATVIGIFENCYLRNLPLPVVRPGSQSRRFTHITDTVKVCYKAWKSNKSRFYSISNKDSYTILEVAKMFGKKIKFLPSRKGERYASALTTLSLSNKIYRTYGKINLSDYVKNFVKNSKK